MVPYQDAGRVIRSQAEEPIKALASAASVGSGLSGAAVAGTALIKRALPFISKYIPQDLAIKGLNSIDPRFGKFIRNALNDGHDFDEVKNFIEEKGVAEIEKQEKPPEEKNIIQKYSPSIYEEMKELIGKGMPPIQAGRKMRNRHGIDGNTIKQIEKDYKTDWLSIVESIFGKGDMAQPNQPEQSPPMQPEAQSQQPQVQPQSGQGQQALMGMLQKINQRLGQQ